WFSFHFGSNSVFLKFSINSNELLIERYLEAMHIRGVVHLFDAFRNTSYAVTVGLSLVSSMVICGY
ncbi:hypothetical protein L9F63_001596, partial [Diploptera punctata]